MGSLRRFDLRQIRAATGIGELVETGSGLGDSLAYARESGIPRCWSVELHPELAQRCQKRFAADPAVTIVATDSSDFLGRLPEGRDPRLFFLDAHFVGGADFGLVDYGSSAKLDRSFPLLDEIAAVLVRLRERDIVLIDDAWMYLEGSFQWGECPAYARRWHERDKLMSALESASGTHEVVLLRQDQGYLILLPRALAAKVPGWVLTGPADPVAAVELTPQQLFEFSVAALKAGRLEQARAGFEALRSNAALRAEASHMLGVAAGLAGDHANAAVHFKEAIAIDRTHPEYFANLASALGACGKAAEERGARNDLGVALQMARKHQDAVQVFERILSESPDYVPTLVDMAVALQDLGEYARAFRSAVRAAYLLRADDERVPALLERIRERLPAEFDEALAQVGSRGEADPDARLLLAKALNNCGNSLIRLGGHALAEDSYRISNSIAPQEALVRWNLSHLRLMKGDLEEGFALYEARWKWPGFNFPERNLPKPRWEGESPAGARLLVYAEQGFGDTLQFARFVPELAARGAKVWFEVQQELFWLVKSAFRAESSVEVIPRLADPRAVYGDPEYDAHCGVMSLATHLRVRSADLSARVPYLAPAAEAVARWAQVLGARTKPRVGLVWAGRTEPDPKRSVPIEQVVALLSVPGIEWISLQPGPAKLNAAGSAAAVRELGSELRDFRDTAAVLENLDLLVTVDTAAAHLAGAMGRPVWILLPQFPDWRWLIEGSTSPWYPTARLFRQRSDGGWAQTLSDVALELRTFFGPVSGVSEKSG